MNNYAYLRPPSYIVKRTGYYDTTSQNQSLSTGRKRHQLTNQQSQSLHRLKQYVKHKYPHRQISDNVLLRYCQLGQFRTNQSVDKLRNYEDWWAMGSIDKNKQKGILHSGVFYCYGRDYQYSPNIYFNPSRVQLIDFKIEDYLVSLRTLLIPIEEHMLILDKIQQWNVIIDARNFNETKLKNNLPNIMNYIYRVCYAYPYRTKRIFLLNSNNLLSKIGIQKNNLTSIQQILQNLGLENKVIKISNLKHFDNYISKQQRQKQYGGFLEDLTQYWPISSTNKLMQVNSKFVEGSELSISQYNSILNEANAEFFGEKSQNPPPKCQCCIQ